MLWFLGLAIPGFPYNFEIFFRKLHENEKKKCEGVTRPLAPAPDTPPVADLGFPVGGGADPLGGVNIQFCQIFQKTA